MSRISDAQSSVRQSADMYTLSLKSPQLKKQYFLYVGPEDRLADVEEYLKSQPSLVELHSMNRFLFRQTMVEAPLPHSLRIKQIAGNIPCQFDLFIDVVNPKGKKVDACCKCSLF